MSKMKKIILAVIAVILVPAIFFAGYLFGAGKIPVSLSSVSSSHSTESEPAASSEKTKPMGVERYIKPDAENNGFFRDMLSDNVIEIYDALKKHLLDERRTDNIDFASNQQNEVKLAYRMLLQDHPEIFWVDEIIDVDSLYTDDNGDRKVSFSFTEVYTGSFNDIDKGLSEYERIVEEIKNTRKSESRYDTLKAIQDYICDKMSYDTTNNDEVTSYLDAFAAPLFNCGSYECKTICGGYAKSFKALCNAFDIPCVIIKGESLGDYHAWNNIQMEDGNWYGVDLTGDDAGNPVPHKYNYFIKGANDSVLEKGFFFWGYEDVSTFGESHTPEHAFDYYGILLKYPIISDETYKYDN